MPILDAATAVTESESSQIVPSDKYCQVLVALVGFVMIDAFYSILAKDALSSGNTKALVFSFYRDLGAFPILLIAACLFDGPRLPLLKEVPIFALLA